MRDAASLAAPRFAVPAGACDCHMHVFGDPARYPLAPFRSYDVGEAPLEAYRATQRRLGLDRVVFVQASGYHTDNRCMLDAMAALGRGGRGIAVVDDGVVTGELRRMHEAGVRGIRVNLASVGSLTARQAAERMARLARRVADLGWHVQLFLPPAQLAELAPRIAGLPVAAVIDHMGLPRLGEGVGQPAFAALLRLVETGRCWVKLSGADRIARGHPDHAGVAPFACALIAAAPERLVWGSDWPHIGWHGAEPGARHDLLPFRPEDDGALLDLLLDWAPDAAVRERILAVNPARLYDF